MRPRRDPVPRARDAWSWLLGTALLGILGAGVVAAAVLLWENIDIRPLAPQLAVAPPLPVPEPPTPAAHADVAFDAAVFDSPANRGYFPDSTYHRRTLEAWEELIGASGGRVRRVATAAELRTLGPTDVLVLAETPCLSDGELAAVRAHVRRSGSVVASWAVGARAGSCRWKGWDFVAELSGAEDVREIPARPGLFLTVPGRVALSSGLAPGTRIELRPDPSLALRLEGARVYWSDWALNPQPDETGAGADAAAVATHSDDGGRVTWFGMRLGQAVTPMDSVRLRRLIQNGVLWAAGVPVATASAWPGGRAAALVVSLDVEDDAHNAVATAELLAERGVPGTFFVVSQLVQGDSALARALTGAGEVGSQTADHTPVAGLTSQDQRVRLRRSWSEVEAWTGRGPQGLHPPEERFDGGTLAGWAATGGTYLLATNEARSASPEIHRVGAAEVVVLPRLLRDDYNIIVQDRVIRASGLAKAYLAGMRKHHAIGGLAVVSAHTQIMRPGGRIDALGSVLDSARVSGDWWIASAGAVAEWWATRDDVRLSFVRPGAPGALTTGGTPAVELLIEAPPDRAVVDLWVDIVLPDAPASAFPLVDGVPVGFTSTDWGMRVPVGDLLPGGTRLVSVLPSEAGDEGTPWT
ncbi:MAG TPA: polysaccharide deacetylase family protein [Longimicrobiales bacterium]|nr:polysaccharide deacetylase family protein [Longimicrobiales bacterium]